MRSCRAAHWTFHTFGDAPGDPCDVASSHGAGPCPGDRGRGDCEHHPGAHLVGRAGPTGPVRPQAAAIWPTEAALAPYALPVDTQCGRTHWRPRDSGGHAFYLFAFSPGEASVSISRLRVRLRRNVPQTRPVMAGFCGRQCPAGPTGVIPRGACGRPSA